MFGPVNLPFLARELTKRIAYRSRLLGWLARPAYEYNLHPGELALLVDAIDRTRDLGGVILEVGVARGLTTIFLREHMRCSGDTRRYICVDTFNGFTPADVAFEREERHREGPEYGIRGALGAFSYNDVRVFRRNLNGYQVDILKKDCGSLTLGEIGPVAVALLDVDLYKPTKRAIGTIYDALIPGGLLMVDDVPERCGVSPYDGAHAAYHEFCAERGIAPRLVAHKAGILTK